MALYPHQIRVRELLMAGENVILQAPTGAGKTRAAIEPFLHSINLDRYGRGGFLPRKLIYSVPMRVLAKQFYQEYDEITATFNTRKRTDIKATIQTGDMPKDPTLEKDIIFATIDQTLSSFVMAPYGLSRGRANLNLGALLSSYLVFDEFHLYDPDSTLITTLQMLRMLDGIVPFVLMTATFSAELITRLAQLLNAEVVGLSEEDRRSFAALDAQNKTRYYHTVDAPLTPERILAQHKKRSVVICNTVERARHMAAQLRANTDARVILLTSQFLREDRDHIEDEIRQLFGKSAQADATSVIVVATQAIEVGVDITSTAMHTELAPANAIIQRAGRCARYEGNVGDVYIYRHVLDASGEVIDLAEKTAPYVGKLQSPQMEATFTAFQQRSGQAFKFDDEQAVIDIVHGDADREVLNMIDAKTVEHCDHIFAAMLGAHDHIGPLVRNVIAQPVTIHAQPHRIEKPYRLPSFSLHPGTLRKYVNNWLQRYHAIVDDDLVPNFAVKYLIADTDPDDSTQMIYRWEDVQWNAEKERAQYIPFGALVVVHPDLASYTGMDGFLPDSGGGWDRTFNYDEKGRDFTSHRYQLETYAEHIRLVYKSAFTGDPERDYRKNDHRPYWDEAAWAAKKLEEKLDLPAGTIRQAAELTIRLHDVGKLSTGWQRWVRDYQAAIGQPTNPGEAYAHTDYDPAKHPHHDDVQKGMRRRPPHAVESAVASSLIITQQLPQSLVQPVFTAISRHHGAFTANYTPVKLASFALEKVNATLTQPAERLLDQSTAPPFNNGIFTVPGEGTITQFFVYALLVRLLRLSDNRGTRWGAPI